jgi:preprotein translocase subunit YajC
MTMFLSADATGGSSMWVLILFYAVLIGGMYLLLARPQQKKRKKEEKMRNNIQIGDEITTIGGIVGRVVSIKADQDMLVIETGTDRARLKVKKWAVGSVDTIHDDAE